MESLEKGNSHPFQMPFRLFQNDELTHTVVFKNQSYTGHNYQTDDGLAHTAKAELNILKYRSVPRMKLESLQNWSVGNWQGMYHF